MEQYALRETQDPKRRIETRNLKVGNIQVALSVTENVKLMLNAIKSLNFTKNTELRFGADDTMKYIAEESKYFQATIEFKKDFFSHYKFVPTDIDEIVVGVDFHSFIEFFAKIADNSLATLKMVNFGDTRPMAFSFIHNDTNQDDLSTSILPTSLTNLTDRSGEIVTEYIIHIKHRINPINFEVEKLTELSTIVMEAAEFASLIQEFDRGMDELEFKITAESIMLLSESYGYTPNSTKICIKNNMSIIHRYDHKANSDFFYKFMCFKSMAKSLTLIHKISITTYDNGIMKIDLGDGNPKKGKPFSFQYILVPTLNE